MTAEADREEEARWRLCAAPVLTDLQLALLDYVTNAAEPTWIMLQELPETGGQREIAEYALEDLEARGLVRRTREPSGNPEAGFLDDEDWWALTDKGRELLAMSPPPNYG